MSCVVCLEEDAAPDNARCRTRGCRGLQSVCAACARRVDVCVFCRAPRADVATLEETMFIACYFCNLLAFAQDMVDCGCGEPGADR